LLRPRPAFLVRLHAPQPEVYFGGQFLSGGG